MKQLWEGGGMMNFYPPEFSSVLTVEGTAQQPLGLTSGSVPSRLQGEPTRHSGV